MLKIIYHRKIYFIFSSLLIIASIVFLVIWGLRLGIDFTGGSLLEVTFKEMDRPASEEIAQTLNELDLGEINIQPAGSQGILIRLQPLTEEEHQKILSKLRKTFIPEQEVEIGGSEPQIQIEGEGAAQISGIKAEKIGGPKIQEERFDSIGPSIGQELKRKSLYAIIIVIAAIIAYIAWSFRKVGKPVASWKYGVIAIIALVHDLIIVCGIFAVLGHYFNLEINTSFVAAILTILGYSVNDSIVVFDRIRENLHRYQGDFEETINLSVNETIPRSINTSLTTLLVLLAVYLFGGETIKDFILALMIGIISGTYSSIFLASPLLVTGQKLTRRFGH